MNKIFKIMIKTMIQYPICIVILFTIYLIRPIVLVRIGLLSTWRMGHLSHDLEIYLADRNFFRLKSIDFFANTHLVSNQFLKKKWGEKIKFINSTIGFPIININRLFHRNHPPLKPLFNRFYARS